MPIPQALSSRVPVASGELGAAEAAALAEALPGGLGGAGFEALVARIDCGRFSAGDRITVHTRGESAFAAMLRVIDDARQEVLVESYILKDDHVGREVAKALIRARERGAAVRVLADAFGSYFTKDSFWAQLRSHGIEVRLFRPVLRNLWKGPRRDHRKLLVGDRRAGFTGGMNIADDYGSARHAKRGVWRDTQVEVHGPCAREMAHVFAQSWLVAGGGDFATGGDAEAPVPEERGGARCLVLDSRAGKGDGKPAALFAAILGAARRNVWITNSYFAPVASTAIALVRAAQRGVDVRLLLAGPTDVPVVRHAGHGFFAEMLQAGVKVYEYQAAVLHAKTLCADDTVSLIGSSNLDFRSFHVNRECDLVIIDEATGRRMAEVFREDVEHAVAMREPEWYKRGLLHRAFDRVARSFRPAL